MSEETPEIRRAKDQALRFLSRRAHGEQELYQKLCRQHEAHNAAAAVAAMVDLDLLDDVVFARDRAEMLAQRGKSVSDIRHRLGALGLRGDEIDAALAEIDIDEEASALRIIQKNYQQKLASGRRDAVMAALSRRGFSHAVIQRAVRAAQGELEAMGEGGEQL